MAQHLTLRGVQQSLAPRGIRIARADPYPDGRSRYQVWPNGQPRSRGRDTDDIELGYIIGLRMKTQSSPGGAAPAFA